MKATNKALLSRVQSDKNFLRMSDMIKLKEQHRLQYHWFFDDAVSRTKILRPNEVTDEQAHHKYARHHSREWPKGLVFVLGF